MESFAVWQSRPVFVTSTFRDFQAERDHLHSHVFPELEERLKARFHHLEPIDLRWGVDNASLAEEEARQRLVLKVCLAEILRSRPFLIGLIGDRYGWVPPLERMQAAAQEAGHQGKLEGKSVTALEIEYGVLDNPDQCARSRFYFRKPLHYDAMDPSDAAVYSERHSGEPDAAAAQANLDALKARVRRELPGRWRSYRAQWAGKQRRVVGLDDWGRQVLEDLWADLETETAAYAGADPATWQRQEAWLIEQFVETKRRDFVGRESVLAALEAQALSPAAEGAAWGLCLTGPAGGGKSAVFAELCRRLSGRDLLLLAQAAGIGIRSGQVQPLLRRWIGELAQALGLPDPAESLTKQEELEQTFASLLGRAARTRRVVCLLDALNQFEPTSVAQHLTWLPKPWPANARLIATAIPGTQSEALAQRPGTVTRALPPLDPAEAGAVADALCRRYRKQLPESVRAALAAKRRPDGQLAAGTPLWLSLAVEELLLLDADDFARARTMPGETAGERMRALLLDVAQSLPPEVETLYAYLLERAEEIHGRDWTRAFVEATALSRHGWREGDLEALVPKLSGHPWTDLDFAALRRAFRAHLVQRGAQGQWGFAHAQLRAAVERRNLADPAARRALHTRLADHLATLPAEDPLRQTERMYHLIHADDRPRVAAYYGGLEIGSPERAGATATLAEHLLQGEAQTPNPHLVWTLGLLALPDQPPATTAWLCNTYLFDLGEALENQARMGLRFALFQGAQQALARLAAADPGKAGWQRDLSVSYIKVGEVLVAQGDLAGAQRAYRASLEIAERLAALEPRDAGWQRDLAASRSKVGEALVTQGDLAGAQRAYRASLEIAQRLAASNPDNAGWQRDLSVSHRQVGEVLVAQGDLAGALRAYRAAQEIAERLAALEPGNAERQRDLAGGRNMVGDVLVAQGDLAGAQRAYRASMEIAERLAAADPGNAGWQLGLSANHDNEGKMLVAQGDLAGALRAYRVSLAIRERLAALDPGNAGWQRALTVGHGQVGEVLVDQGDLAGALRAYRASLEIAERLAALAPGNTRWQRDLSVSHSKVGKVLVAQGNLAGAQRAYRATQEIAERLAALEPGNAGWQHDLSVSHIMVGDVLVAQGDLAGAQRAYRASIEIAERLAALEPGNAGWQHDLSVSHEMVGDVLVTQGDLAGAQRAYRASLEMRERLAALEPGNAGWQRDLSVSHSKVGKVLVAQGDLAGAQRAYRVRLEIMERLTAADPGNAGWQHDLAVSHIILGGVLKAQGNLAGAQRAYRASLEIAERLAAADPSNAGWQHDLSASHDRVGDVLVAQGDLAGALRAYRATHEILERLAGANPGNAGWQRDLSVSHNKVGDVLVAQGDLAGALRAYRASLAIAERLASADPSNAGWQRDLWLSHAKIAQALEQSGHVDAGSHWRRAFEILSRMEQAGGFLSPQDRQFFEALRRKVQSDAVGGDLLAKSSRLPATGAAAEGVPAPAPAPGSAPRVRDPVDLDRVRSLLSQGQPKAALELIQSGDHGPPEVRNAHAVCLMRLGNLEGAVKLLRGLVLPNDVMSIDRDIPDKYKLNFATALLLEGNFDGSRNALAALQDPKHPTAARLREAEARWRKSLSLGQKLGLWLGSMPDVPIELGAPPGEV